MMSDFFPNRAATQISCCGLGLSLLIVASGCAVERSSLSMDSNSRSPFLGLQLAPPKRKEPAIQRPISRDQNGAEAKVSLAVAADKSESKWSDWLNPLPQRVSQPLPRTEPEKSASVPADVTAADAEIEF